MMNKRYKLQYMPESESALSKREKPAELAEKLAKYDIISFDVFDTLIFRAFSEPADLFFAVGEKLKWSGFKSMRIAMEKKARKNKYKTSGTHEVTLDEIWELIKQKTGIEKQLGINTEWHCELEYCFANPYMLQVVNRLQELNKKIIVISDMYLQQKSIKEMLSLCGYDEFQDYFISADYGVSKRNGRLYDRIKAELGFQYSYIHIGDNAYSDQKQALSYGWSSYLYDNVNLTGKKYRVNMSDLAGSIYQGIINAYLHNGLYVFSKEYELGFVYYGFLIVSCCQWIQMFDDIININNEEVKKGILDFINLYLPFIDK